MAEPGLHTHLPTFLAALSSQWHHHSFFLGLWPRQTHNRKIRCCLIPRLLSHLTSDSSIYPISPDRIPDLTGSFLSPSRSRLPQSCVEAPVASSPSPCHSCLPPSPPSIAFLPQMPCGFSSHWELRPSLCSLSPLFAPTPDLTSSRSFPAPPSSPTGHPLFLPGAQHASRAWGFSWALHLLCSSSRQWPDSLLSATFSKVSVFSAVHSLSLFTWLSFMTYLSFLSLPWKPDIHLPGSSLLRPVRRDGDWPRTRQVLTGSMESQGSILSPCLLAWIPFNSVFQTLWSHLASYLKLQISRWNSHQLHHEAWKWLLILPAVLPSCGHESVTVTDSVTSTY